VARASLDVVVEPFEVGREGCTVGRIPVLDDDVEAAHVACSLLFQTLPAFVGDEELACHAAVGVGNALDQVGIEHRGGLPTDGRGVQVERLAELADGHGPLDADAAEQEVGAGLEVAFAAPGASNVSCEKHRLEFDSVRVHPCPFRESCVEGTSRLSGSRQHRFMHHTYQLHAAT